MVVGSRGCGWSRVSGRRADTRRGRRRRIARRGDACQAPGSVPRLRGSRSSSRQLSPPPWSGAGPRGGPAVGPASGAATRGGASGGPARGAPRRGRAARPGRRTRGPRELRVLEQPGGERLLGGRRLVDGARQQPQHRVDDHERRRARRRSARSRRSRARGRRWRGPDRRRPRSAGTGRRGARRAARSWATAWRNGSPTGSSRITIESGRRSASSAAATTSTRRTMPAPPP